jgi:hypothetical protein
MNYEECAPDCISKPAVNPKYDRKLLENKCCTASVDLESDVLSCPGGAMTPPWQDSAHDLESG